MAWTPLAREVERIASVGREAIATGIPADEVLERRAVDRREFLRRGAKLGAAVAAFPLLSSLAACTSSKRSPNTARIVIVGAGLGGITAAYRLAQAGHRSTVYEATDRVGGRTWTLRDFFDGGQYAEHGAELINTSHTLMIALAQELDLELVDLLNPYPPHVAAVNHFNGRTYSWGQALRDYAVVYPAMHRDTVAAGSPTYKSFTPAARRLDRLSCAEWVERNVPGGLASDFGKMLAIAYTTEDGLDMGEMSSIQMLAEIGNAAPARKLSRALTLKGGRGWLYGAGKDGDERYQVNGGNDQVAGRMADHLPKGSVVLESPLEAVVANSNDTVTCTFRRGGKAVDVTADFVVLALPFTALQHVDYARAGFSALKVRAIKEFGMGTNSKFHMQFDRRIWIEQHCDGETSSDTGYQQTWETDHYSATTTGVLTNFTGGSVGAGYTGSPPHATAPAELVRRTLEKIDPVLPGLGALWNGKAWLDFWAADPWHFGSYSSYKPGQLTEFGGIQGVPEGHVHFAGEHTSRDFWGFMEGAARTGQAAARAIGSALGSPRA